MVRRSTLELEQHRAQLFLRLARLGRLRVDILRTLAEQRALVALVVVDGQSYKEAAAILEIPIGTVMSRLARARRAIDLYVNGAPYATSSS